MHPVWISTLCSLAAGLILSLQILPTLNQRIGGFWSQSFWFPRSNAAEPRFNLAQLGNAAYQFCSEPEPKDWRQGAGVCFWFKKVGNEVLGIYGYPHSGRYIDCISGAVDRQSIRGKAVAIASSANDWPQLPQTITWDEEGHLRLGAGSVVYTERWKSTQLDIIQFRNVVVNLQGFYQYSAAKVKQMPTLPKTCDIAFWKQQTAMMLRSP